MINKKNQEAQVKADNVKTADKKIEATLLNLGDIKNAHIKENKKSTNKKPSLNHGFDEADYKNNKKIAWLAYILFFIPLLINNKSEYVKFHANEGLEINIVDIIGISFILIGKFVVSSQVTVSAFLVFLFFLGLGLLAVTIFTRILMIIICLCGIKAQVPWFTNIKFIK